METREEYIEKYGDFDRRKFVTVKEPVDDTEVQFIDGYDCSQVDDFLDIIIAEGIVSKMALAKANKRIKELEAENARLKEQTPKWISASERMPKQNETDDDDNVWVYNRSGVYKQNYENVRVSDMWMQATIPPPPVTEKSSETERR